MKSFLSKRVTVGTAAVLSALSWAAAGRADDGAKAAKPVAQCMMWRASSDTATVYMVGSMHFAKPEMYPLPKEVEEAFGKADTLVVEVNINKVDQQKVAKVVQEKGMYGGDDKLSAHLKPETWTDLKAACEKVGLPEEGAEKMKPWLVGIALPTLALQQLGLDPALGIDKHFLDAAEKKSLKVEELESVEFQMDLLAGFDADVQEKSLVLALARLKDISADFDKLVEAWSAGDAAGLDKVMNSSKDKPGAEVVMQKLVYDRNGPMEGKIKEYLKGNKTVFVVVGCAHLVGDKGIVKMLQDDKVKVEQSAATK